LPHSRAAIDTIKGYFYQFDYSILQLIDSSCESDAVCIEGIEDIDINANSETIAVQCKYYAGTEYNNSVIGEPIRLMLKHYADIRSSGHIIKYAIYGHYSSGQNKLPGDFDLQFFKENFLAYTKERKKYKLHEEIGLNDEDITVFIQNLTININAPSYEEQEQQIFNKLKRLFSASDFESEYYYYNNALREVKKLSIMKDKDDRTITKGEFISRINKKDVLFNTWFIKKKGADKYCKAIKRQFFSEYNVSPYERFFLIDCNESIPEIDLKMLAQSISKKRSKLSRRSQDTFCPYVYFHNISNEKLKKLKELLQLDGFYFSDGYDFKDADFFVKSICKKATSYNEIKLKIISNIGQIDDILNSLSTTREIYQFFTKESFYENTVHMHIKIPIVETKDINAII
jgi:hypothetical protein